MDRVLIIAPFYNYYPILIQSMELQTHKNWHLFLMHDGPPPERLLQRLYKNTFESTDRSSLDYTIERHNDWGHTLREEVIQKIDDQEIPGDYVIHTNGDNYYTPEALESMVDSTDSGSYSMVVCGMINNKGPQRIYPPRIAPSQVDCGQVLLKREVAIQVGWKHRHQYCDWDYIKEAAEICGRERITFNQGVFFVHN